MLHLYFNDAKFWQILLQIDEELASTVQSRGCPHCGGQLHCADYPRKPRGIAGALLGEAYQRRRSFCCAREGCRRRTTPQSVRFLGRRVYLGALVVLVVRAVPGDALVAGGARTIRHAPDAGCLARCVARTLR